MDFLMRLDFESIFEDEEEDDYFSQVPVNDEGDKEISLESDPPLHDNPVAIDMDEQSAERKLEQEQVIEDMENVNAFDEMLIDLVPLVSTITFAEAKINDFDAELRFIEEWIAKPKIVADCIETAKDENKDGKQNYDEEILASVKILICLQPWRPTLNVNFEEFYVKMNNTTRPGDFKIWLRKPKKKKKYGLTATKVKMKKEEDCRVQGLEP